MPVLALFKTYSEAILAELLVQYKLPEQLTIHLKARVLLVLPIKMQNLRHKILLNIVCLDILVKLLVQSMDSFFQHHQN